MADHFFLFSKLPPELRLLIWEAALPRRTILYRSCNRYESVIHGPPTIAQVCRESRIVALKNGSPHALKFKDGRKRNTLLTWYDASRDMFTVRCECTHCLPPVRKQSRLLCGIYPAVKYVSFEFHQRLIDNGALRIDDNRFLKDISLLLRKLRAMRRSMENIGHVNIILNRNSFGDLGGKASVVRDAVPTRQDILVDLTDEMDVEIVAQILYRHLATRPAGSKLMKTHAAVRGHIETDAHLPYAQRGWEFVMQALKHTWLQECYRRDWHTEPSAIYMAYNDDINEGNAWVKSVLSELPRITPVFAVTKDIFWFVHMGPNKGTRKVSWNGNEWVRNRQ